MSVWIHCDRCSNKWKPEKPGLTQLPKDWFHHEGKHLCPTCINEIKPWVELSNKHGLTQPPQQS
jgi:hypothetical protein